VIGEEPVEFRTGLGTDIHRLVEGRKLMLGGVQIPHPMGLSGHSDGDAVLHAVADALLGAAGMGDIGTFFPDTDPKWKDADSKGFLFTVKEKLAEKKWEVVNVDVTIHAEQPRLEAFKGQIKRVIAGLLGIDFNAVNIKAKTNNGIGEIGEGTAIGATVAALIRKKTKRTL
jgi:2-C-methyl-D-erythritol 2,4-cyclodiphosphate synthase